VGENCQQSAMSHCLSSADPACAALLYRFERLAGETVELRIHADAQTLELDDCGCAEPCSTAVRTFSRTQDLVSKLWTFSLYSSRAAPTYLCDDKGKTVAVIDFGEGCPVSASTGPCGADSCEDPESEECQLLVASYCTSVGSKVEGCSLFTPRFLRELGSVQFDFHAVVDSETVTLSPEHSFCDSSAEDSVVLEQEYVEAAKLLKVKAYIWTPGVFRVCAGKTTLATVRTLAPEKAFDIEGAPCDDKLCEDLGNEACNQVCAAYCAGNPEDGGCKLRVPTFERPAGALAELRFHVPVADRDGHDLTAITQVVAQGCGCNCADENLLLGLATDPVALSVYVSFAPPDEGVYEVCAGERVVARVMAVAPCLFDDLSAAPCLACGATYDHYDEECALLALEYCQTSPHDGGCARMVVHFERPLGKRSELDLFADATTSSVFFIPETCDCMDDCAPTAKVGDTVLRQSDTRLRVSFHAYSVGVVKLCAATSTATTHIATLKVTPGACLFANPGLCQCDFATLDEPCVLAAAEYCKRNPTDPGCNLLIPVYDRPLGKAAIQLPGTSAATVKPCKCSDTCTALTATVAAVSHFVRLDFSTPVAGQYHICSGSETLALVRVSASCSTALPGGMCAGLPCDPTKDACPLLFAEACASTPDDPACAYAAFKFTRAAGEPTSVALHLADASTDVRFAAPSCGGCAKSSCTAHHITIRDIRADAASHELYVEFESPHTGTVELCHKGEVIADVKLERVCAFEDGVDSPCRAEECAEGSDLPQCIEYAGQYCATRDDPGCALFRPYYELPAEQLTSLTLTSETNTLTVAAMPCLVGRPALQRRRCRCAARSGMRRLPSSRCNSRRLLPPRRSCATGRPGSQPWASSRTRRAASSAAASAMPAQTQTAWSAWRRLRSTARPTPTTRAATS
jgi:hypothetical protein